MKFVRTTRIFWTSLAAVLLLHVLVLAWLSDTLVGWIRLLPSQEPSPVEVSWVLPPPPVQPSPQTKVVPPFSPPAAESSPIGPSPPQPDPAPSTTESSPIPRPRAAEMPKPGVLAVEAYWGVHALDGQPLGRGEIRLEYPNPGEYTLTLTAKAVGWLSVFVSEPVELMSAGRLGPDGLVPTRFKQNTPRRPPAESRFDPTANTAQLNADAPVIPAPQGLQDRLSVAFQLAWIGESQPRGLEPGQRFEIPLATHKELRTVAFQVGDPEDLVLPGGILVSALRVTSDPFQTRRMGQIDLWLDPADRHFPVRILYSEPGGRALDFLAIRSAF